MRLILALSLYLAIVTISYAESPKFGWAMLAIQHKEFPCRQARKIAKVHRYPYVAYLDSTFGRKMECIEAFVQEANEKPHVVQAYLSNEVCRRKRNCQRGDFLRHLNVKRYNKKLSRHDPEIKRRVIKKAQQILINLQSISSPTTELRITMGLESQFTKAAAIALHGYLIEAGWDRSQIIINQVGNARQFRAGAKYIENHHIRKIARGEGLSFDGECGYAICDCHSYRPHASEASLKKSLRQHKHLDYILAWCPKHQGLLQSSTLKAPPPRKRRIKVRGKDIKDFKQFTQRYEAR